MALQGLAQGHGAVVETRELQAGPYRILLTRKRIKRAYLRVDDAEGPVRVSAPARMSLAAVRAFVEAQAPWIESRRALLRNTPRASSRRGHITEDGQVLLWGASLPFTEVAPKALAPAKLKAAGAITAGEYWRGLSADERGLLEKRVLASLKSHLAAEAEPLVRHYEQVMGVTVHELRYRDMHTRWGTCNVRAHRVWLALSLAHFPKACTELIVVHELSHLIEPGHGPRFKACMDRFLPDWREREALLNNLKIKQH